MMKLVIIQKEKHEKGHSMTELKTIETEHIPVVGDYLINVIEEYTTYQVIERVFSFNVNEVHIYVKLLIPS